MNILFAGTPKPSAKILRALCNETSLKVVGVITKPDKAQKRGNKIEQSPVCIEALKQKLNIFKPDSLNCEELRKSIEHLNVDYIIVAAYGKILPKWLLDFPNIMPVNIHYSLLPKYRGASPIQSSLLNNDTRSGITFMKMSEGLDDGDCIEQYVIDIKNNHNKITLENDLCDLSISKILDILHGLKNHKYNLIKQDNKLASYCSKIQKSDSLVSFTETANQIYSKFKAYYEWPGVSFIHKNTLIKIKDMYLIDDNNIDLLGKEILLLKDGLYIKTSNKVIVITYLQFPNKNIISASDAFNSYKDFFNE
ncbi:methionyl-tRNA formyltransferase [Gammaproteobacteria bacterium]|nr:methionyl-tRNA formyltransferase [Gammaproteobacteria bacterium]MDC0401222.1 methionyl-tRNA formyltransferase [Gammaproteobacteria bacterium]MDC1074858.1 methionyl-tRNA formyltransferase [Gammaproteobacteria bacterium]